MDTLPNDYLDTIRPLLGDAGLLDYQAALTEPPVRGFRLQRCRQRTNEPTDSAWLSVSTALTVPQTLQVLCNQPIPWYPDGFYLEADDPLGKTVLHEIGAVYIQEPSAMAAVTALNPQPGERILDLCAAPGSKTTAIGRALRGTGELVCNDIHPVRVQTLAQNLERTGIPALVVQAQPAVLAQVFPGYFDAVLVDAPCSGEGMFRKEPAAIREWHPGLAETCAARQREILQQAAAMVRPGGRIVYSTCTLNRIENEVVLAWALRTLPVRMLPLPEWPGWDQGDPAVGGGSPELSYTRRLWPHRGGGEGHFVSLLQVEESPGVAEEKPRPTRRSASAERSETKALADQLSQWLKSDKIPAHWLTPDLHGSGAYVYAVTGVDLTRIRVVRNGICLATREHRDWKPHHQLAMALAPGVASEERALDPEQAARYIAGEALPDQGQRGMVWLHLDGMPVGFGKAVAGRVNNGYPKGLRKRVHGHL